MSEEFMELAAKFKQTREELGMVPDTAKRMGKFSISNRVLHSLGPLGRVDLMHNIVVWHTTARMDRDEITYYAEHPGFDIVPEGEMVPEYTAEITERDDGTFDRIWVKNE